MKPRPHYPPGATALPARLRRRVLLVVGAGDVGLRLVRLLARSPRRFSVVATTRSDEQAARLRVLGARVLAVDLDDRRQARRLGGLAQHLVHLSPPPPEGARDPRTAHLLAAALAHPAERPRRWVYVSTTGVYGDCAGARFDETRPVAPATGRALRRVDAERQLRARVRGGQLSAAIVRAPGIYARERLPVERLRAGLPALRREDDVYTSHVHADDLAGICLAALVHGRPGRVYHAVDRSDLPMGDYLDLVADAAGIARPPRLPRAALAAAVSPAMLSFMSESRRPAGRRLARELRYRLRCPDVRALLHTL